MRGLFFLGLVGGAGCTGEVPDRCNCGNNGNKPDVDDSGAGSDSDSGADSEAPPEPKLSINELMADNETAYTPDGQNWPDWIELYNAGPGAVDLTGWGIIDGEDDPPYVLPAGLTIAEGVFLLLYADGSTDGGVHLPFSLRSTGEQLLLFNPSGRRVDWVDFGDQLQDISASRAVDGSDKDGWLYVPGGTPGRSNQ